MLKLALRSALAASALALAAFGFTPGEAQAAACVANTPIDLTNPDAQLEHSTSCGQLNNTGSNETDTENAIEGATGLTLTHLDRDNNGDSESDNGFLFIENSTTGNPANVWAIDTDINNYTGFVISFKDGDPLSQGFVYFVIDTTQNSGTCPAGYELCGTWLMYGESGTRKSVSHADLFGYTPGNNLPEPASMLLLATVLGGIGMTTRRRKAV